MKDIQVDSGPIVSKTGAKTLCFVYLTLASL